MSDFMNRMYEKGKEFVGADVDGMADLLRTIYSETTEAGEDLGNATFAATTGLLVHGGSQRDLVMAAHKHHKDERIKPVIAVLKAVFSNTPEEEMPCWARLIRSRDMPREDRAAAALAVVEEVGIDVLVEAGKAAGNGDSESSALFDKYIRAHFS